MKKHPLLFLLCLSGLTVAATAQDVRLGLVAYWPLDEVSPDGLTTPDKSPAPLDLTLVNMDATNLTVGMRGNGMTFNGTDEISYANTGGAVKEGLPLQGNVRKTICLWIRANGATQTDRRFFAEASMLANPPMFNMGTDSSATAPSGKLDIYIRADSNTATVNHAKSSGSPMDGAWHHLALTDDNGVVRYFIDGVQDPAALTYTRPVATLDTISLGGIRRLSGNLALLNGTLDDVAVWNRILSPAEIQQVMNNGLATPVPPLLAASRPGPYRQGDFIRLTMQYPGQDTATFQWRRNGVDIAGATERTYAIQSLSSANQGDYSVMVNGTALSDTLTFGFTPDPSPTLGTNLVSWWPFEALDESGFPFTTPDPWGGHPLSAVDIDSTNLVLGKFGSAMAFDGVTEIAHRTTGFPVASSPEYTVAFWVKADGTAQNDLRLFAEGSDATNTPLFGLGTAVDGSNRLRLYLRSDNNVVQVAAHSESPVLDDTWHHVAWTDRNGQTRLYVDGVMDGANFNYNRATATFTLNQTSVGGIKRLLASNWGRSTMDDVAVWNRALTWTEIQGLVTSGVPAPVSTVPPEISVQPLARTVWQGRAVSFSVQVTGTAPFTYTWRKNGDPISAPDAPTLVIDPTVPGDSGTYSCVVMNAAGTDTSDPAALVVRAITGLASGQLTNWPLNAGETVTVDTLSAHDLTLSNVDPATAWQIGVNNNAVKLDGTDDLLSRTRTGVGGDIPLSSREEFSVSFWVRGSGAGQLDRRVFSEGSTVNNQPLFNLGTSTAGTTDRLNVFIRGDAGALPVDHRTSNAAVFDGFWHHVIYTDNRGQVAMYVDGKPDATFSYTRPLLTFNTISLGGILRAAVSHWFNGSLDEVNTWERALSAADAATHFAAQPVVRGTLDVIGWVPMEAGHIQMSVATSHGSTASYVVQASDSLAEGSWVNADDAQIGVASMGVLTVEVYPTAPGRRFYRVMIP